MIQMGSVLDVADNSGARKIACIRLKGGAAGQYGGLGDVITASVKEATPDGTVKKGAVVSAVIVRHHSPERMSSPSTRPARNQFLSNADSPASQAMPQTKRI